MTGTFDKYPLSGFLNALFYEAIKKPFLNKRPDSYIKKTEVKRQIKHVRVTFLDYLDSEGGLNGTPYEDKIL